MNVKQLTSNTVVRLIMVVAILTVGSATYAAEGWSHIEYGAANYGHPSTDSSMFVSQSGRADVSRQFEMLESTILELAASKGEIGTLYLNDLDAEMLAYTAEKIESFLKKNNLLMVKIVLLPGDMFNLPTYPITDTAHLKNPIQLSPEKLAKLVTSSRSGLEIHTHLFENELNRYLTTESTGKWKYKIEGASRSYIFPNGKLAPRPGTVFRLESTVSLCSKLFR